MQQRPLPNTLHRDMVQWRHDFHQHPELGFQVDRTADRVARLLASFGIEVHAQVGGTGVVGILRRGRGRRSIGLRADMDALAITEENTFAHRSRHDGQMHACGHDGHTAMLLGAAAHLAARGHFDGTITFVFQPAEEHGLGARAMIDDGLFERFPVDDVYAMHNLPGLAAGRFAVRPGPIMACEHTFEIAIQGAGTHAALPHMGVDPILIGSEIVVALQSIVSRRLDPVASGVVSVTEFRTGGTRNIIPDQVILRGDTRSFSPAVGDAIEAAMERIAGGICAAHGGRYSFTYNREFVATINSPAEASIAADVACQVVGADRVDQACPPIMASEDFGFMLQHKPGCYLFLGNGDGPGAGGLHTPGYDFNDDVLATGAGFWVRLVESQLTAQRAK